MKLPIAAFLLAGLLASSALAAPSPSPSPAGDKEKSSESEKPRISVTEHTITVNGQVLKYKATAGYQVQSEEPKEGDNEKKPDDKSSPSPEDTKPKARIFYIAYTLEGQEGHARPVTFVFNGGPGAASVWLHLGSLGPRRLQVGQLAPNSGPPFTLVDNESTWLPQTDLVFIDPVSTGYSRPIPGEPSRDFHSAQGDVKSVAEFIRLYTTQNDRWLSPKFVVGESYGGFRAAELCNYLQDRIALYLNGVIIVSGVLNWQNVSFGWDSDTAYPLALPAMASTAWFYKKDAPEYQARSQSDVCAEAEEFALKDYLLALGQGDKLPDAQVHEIAARLAKFTGLPEDYVLQHHLRISIDDFRKELLKADGRAPGRFDSRYSVLQYNPDDGPEDASLVAVHGAFTAAINSYLRTELKFESDLPYQTLIGLDWKFDSDNGYLNADSSLAQTMSVNPQLKVWVCCGRYDLALSYFSTQYTLDHLHLDPSIRANITFSKYDAGHMIYLDGPSRKQFTEDYGKFLKSALP